jgi:CRP-like cAMP-binding protein
MEDLLPDWSAGANRQTSVRLLVNPLAMLCDDCLPGRRRPIRPIDGVARTGSDSIKQQHMIVSPGTDIVTEGERGRGVYTICNGWTIRYRQLRAGTRQIMDVLLPGDIIGLAGLLVGTSKHSVQALTSVSVCMLHGRKILSLLKTDPGFAFGVLRTCIEEDDRIDNRLTMLGRMSAEGRVGYFIVETYDRLNRLGMAQGISCPFPLRRNDLADVVGLSRVHVMRALRELRSQALMEIRGRELIIPDVAKLANQSGYLLA